MRDRAADVMTRAFKCGAVLFLLGPVAVTAANLSSLTVNPTTISSGSPLEVTIAFDAPVPAGGIFVPLTSDHTLAVDVPSFWVAEGALSWGGVVGTGTVPTSTLVTIQASYGGVTKTATVTVIPREPVRGVAGDLWADIILGKPDFTEVTYNEVTSRRVFNARGVLVDRSVAPNRVYVFDSGNSRVLGLSHLGTCAGGVKTGQPCTSNSDCPGSTCAIQEGRGADIVLGQPSMTRSACNGDGAFQRFPVRAPATAATLCGMPEEQISLSEQLIGANMAVDAAGNLYVPDSQNNRVLRYNSPFTTDSIADDVWGQADFVGRECNRGRGQNAPDNQSLCFRNPFNVGFVDGVAIDPGGNLWITDNSNNRVLRFPYDSGTGRPGHVANLVLGQPNFTSSVEGSGLNQMWGPAAVRVNSAGSVYVADSQNGRVLIFDPPLVTGQTARQLAVDFGAVPTGNFGTPTGLEFDPAGGLWINDTYNNQFLFVVGEVVQKVLSKQFPDFNGQCGPDDFINDPPPLYSGDGTGGSSWVVCNSAGSIGVDNDSNVLVSKMDDVWHFPAPIPSIGTKYPADAQIFKPYQFNVQNEAGLAGTYTPSGVVVTADQLIVADRGRLLFWNNPAGLTSGQSATGYVGTTDPRSHPAWEIFGRVRQDGSSRLWATWVDKIRVYSLPLHTGASPISTIAPPLPVLGGGSVTWDDRILVGGIAPVGAGDKVWVVDNTSNRVFRIRNPLTSPVVDIVLGQINVSGTECNQGQGNNSPSQTSLCYPASIRLDPSGNLYVSDSGGEAQGNLRLLEFDAGLFPDSPTQALFAIPASRVFGTGGSFTARACSGLEFCADFREPGFTSGGQMVAGGGGYANSPFPSVYANPLVSQHVSAFLNDYYSCPDSATFDASNNLYVTDGCRARVLVYLNPLSSPATFTLTVTKTGGGTGTVNSNPLGIDCGVDCSQSFINGTVVSLTTLPDANSIFTGWSGDADCADGVVTMNANKTCTATFGLAPPGDLIVSALTVPATGGAGLAITVTDTTKNQGSGSAAASTTSFYLSTNTTWDAGDVSLGSRSIPALAAAAVSTGSISPTIPAGTTTGTYYVIARADAPGVIVETIETNNTRSSGAMTIGPDLIVSALTVPATGGAGLAITVTDTTKNQGGGSAAASTTTFYLSTNTTWDAGDVSLGSRSIPTLAATVVSTSPTSLTIPAGTVSGTYYVLAKADAAGVIVETIETNNTRSSGAIKIGPDLIVSPLSVPATGAAGLVITVTDTTKNQTGTSTAPISTTKFYLSTNTTWDAGDVALGSRSIPSLVAGATSTGPTSLTIPAGTTTGTYYIIAKADADGLIFETSEINNTASGAIKIGPDLIVSSFTVPSAGGDGLPITVNETTKNQGGGSAAASTTKFYLSTNTTWDAGDVALGSRPIPALAAAAVSTGPTSLTIPAGTTSGSYYVIAKSDADGLVLETIESNNTLSRAIKIGPDLIVSALTVPATSAAGGTISVTDTTKNQPAMSTAPASTTKLYLSTNTTWDTGDTYLGSRSIPSLAAGAVSAGPTSLTIPLGTTTGTYYVIAKADADGLVWETSETNNTASGAIKIGPDLIVSALTVPSSAAAGAAISVTDTTKNQGGGSAAASATRLYLSTNTTWDAGDVTLGSRSIPALAAAAVSTGPTSLTIPPGTATGTYYIIAKADADGLVVETSETNNTASGAIKIGPDLIVSALTVPTSAAAGATISVTDTTKNQGGGTASASTTTLYLSTNATYEAGDTSLGSRAVPILAALATSAGSTSVTIPVGTTPGTYYILARADSNASVAETIETNNVTSKAITITP